MDIGKEKPAIIVEPVQDPFAPTQPAPTPEPAPPAERPEKVPAGRTSAGALAADQRDELGLLGRGDTLLAHARSQRGAELLEVLEGHRAPSLHRDLPHERRR